MADPRHPHARLLIALTALFAIRVAAQLLQAVYPVSWLPAFDRWQGSGAPYPLLLAVQIGILLIMVWGVRAVRRQRLASTRARIVGYLLCGGVYFAVMAFRLVAGQTFLAHIDWFAIWLPSVFHLVLAAYILVLGHHLYRTRGSRGGA